MIQTFRGNISEEIKSLGDRKVRVSIVVERESGGEVCGIKKFWRKTGFDEFVFLRVNLVLVVCGE